MSPRCMKNRSLLPTLAISFFNGVYFALAIRYVPHHAEGDREVSRRLSTSIETVALAVRPVVSRMV